MDARPANACVGDCDGDGVVRVDELLLGVDVALTREQATICPAFDPDRNGIVTIAELVAGVNSALGGCMPREREAFVVTTDFRRGSFATVTLDEPHMVSPANRDRRIYQDAVARGFGGLVYLVNRFNADNIQALDPTRDFVTTMQCSVGNGANPHDIAFASATKAYVTRFNEKELYIVDPSVGFDCDRSLLGSIDLSPWADADGFPEMDQMALIGDRLYVSLQRLDRSNFLRPAETGAIVVIDTLTDTVIEEIPLTGENPFAQTKGLVVRDGAIIISESGSFGVNDGGIERVDLASGEAEGFFITEAELGGDLTDFALVSDSLGYAVISLPNFDNSLVRFDPSRGTLIDTVLSGGVLISDIELNDRGELWAADRTATRHGLRIFRAGDGIELTAEPLYLVLPPFDILFLE
jgi:hypothetical protein